MNRDDFVSLSDHVQETILDIAYAGSSNFTGQIVPGYSKALALFPKVLVHHFEAASKIAHQRGFKIKVFDAFRPQMAVDFFLKWSKEVETNEELKKHYYPRYNRDELFDLGYLALQSSHSLGSAIDLTIVDRNSQLELDMGGHFDLFDEISNTHSKLITLEQRQAREELLDIMKCGGFSNYSKEWWHYSIRPVPWNQYLNFEIA